MIQVYIGLAIALVFLVGAIVSFIFWYKEKNTSSRQKHINGVLVSIL